MQHLQHCLSKMLYLSQYLSAEPTCKADDEFSVKQCSAGLPVFVVVILSGSSDHYFHITKHLTLANHMRDLTTVSLIPQLPCDDALLPL